MLTHSLSYPKAYTPIIPTATLDQHIKKTASDLLSLLAKKKKPLPGPKIIPDTLQGLHDLTKIFREHNSNEESPHKHLHYPAKQPSTIQKQVKHKK